MAAVVVTRRSLLNNHWLHVHDALWRRRTAVVVIATVVAAATAAAGSERSAEAASHVVAGKADGDAHVGGGWGLGCKWWFGCKLKNEELQATYGDGLVSSGPRSSSSRWLGVDIPHTCPTRFASCVCDARTLGSTMANRLSRMGEPCLEFNKSPLGSCQQQLPKRLDNLSWAVQKPTRRTPSPSIAPISNVPLSYIEQREAFAFLVPQSMIRRRRQWRQQERERAVRNVFEAQMHTRMRRQSLKQTPVRTAEEEELDCVTIDLGSARSRESAQLQQQLTQAKVDEVRGTQWVPHSIEEECSGSSSEESERVEPVARSKLENDLVLRVLQPLSKDATFRLEHLGGLDMNRLVPTFVYRVFLAEDENHCSGDATEGSAGEYRFPRLLHNSRVNLPTRPAHCYL